jgi:hypothetical protein
MRSRGRGQNQVTTRSIRREGRRLGRFVVFSEMLADLRPISLLDPAALAKKPDQAPALREQGQNNP